MVNLKYTTVLPVGVRGYNLGIEFFVKMTPPTCVGIGTIRPATESTMVEARVLNPARENKCKALQARVP